MKFSNFLILEDSSCSETNCETGTKQNCVSQNACTDKKNRNDYIVCTERNPGTGVETHKWFCKKKEKVNPEPITPTPTPEGECPDNQVDFVKYIWLSNGWVDPAGSQNPDKLTHQTRACGINDKGVALTCDFTKASTMKRKDGTCGEGMRAIWKEKKEDYNTWKKGQQNVVQTTTTTTVKPENPELKKFRDTFDTKIYTDVIDQFRASPDQWEKMYSTNPHIYPVMFYSQMSTITSSILSYMGQNFRSSEFGLFKRFLDEFVTLYGPVSTGENTTEENKIVDPNFFTKFGGTIDQVKQLSKSIEDKNTERSALLGFDFLSDPSSNLEYYFREKLITVMKEASGYVTGSLLMYAWKYTGEGKLPVIDTAPIDKSINDATKLINVQNCENLLDVYGKYAANTLTPQDKITNIVTLVQKCLCNNQYANLGKFETIKDRFNKEKKELSKKRISLLNSMNVSKANC